MAKHNNHKRRQRKKQKRKEKQSLAGQVIEVKVYDRVLSKDEIEEDYNKHKQ